MVNFRLKLKLPKTCKKKLYNQFTVVPSKKRLETANNIQKLTILKQKGKIGNLARALTFTKSSLKD